MSSAVTYTNYQEGRLTKAIWSALPTTLAGNPSSVMSMYADRSVQMIGTFGTSVLSSVALQGSNDGGTTWANLTDPQGNAIIMSSAGLKQLTEVTELVRPNSQGGDSTTAVTVYLFGKKTVI